MKPHVFVSSTFYDLKFVRNDIRQFLDGIGYQALLSEHESFPVAPTEPAIESCRQQVEREADIFVLVIGNRYGSLDKTTLRSITNLEYLAARAKRIPIYAFINKDLEPLLRLWRDNPKVDLSSQIDTPELLRFVDQVKSVDGVWTFTFENASDITETLRSQFAHLMSQGLDWWRRVRLGPTSNRIGGLTGHSLRLALDQPPGWEYYLFAQVIADEVQSAVHLRDEHRENLALELGEDVTEPPMWARRRLDELRRLTDSLGTLINVSAPRAIGPKGTPADVEDLIFVGQACGARVQSRASLESSRPNG